MSSETAPRILVVDDDHKLLEALTRALGTMGYDPRGESSPMAGIERVRRWEPDVAIVDLKMADMDGIELTRRLHDTHPELPVIVLTGFGTIRTAVAAMRAGAYDYLTKPFDLDEVDLALRKALDHQNLRSRNRTLSESLERCGAPGEIVGRSSAVRDVLRSVEQVARTDSTVLVSGETGTGKELVARAVHKVGPRKEAPFVTVDCAALSENLLESELFGHARGAFTGAHRDRAGYFEVASQGTVFLDEVGELDRKLQKTLLRVLQEHTYSRVGETRTRRTGARVVAATNRDLAREVEAGRFREDLMYRLRVIEIRMPPLRERVGDLPLLLRHWLDRLNRKLNRRVEGASPEALAALEAYTWPGNVRELVNVLEHALTFHDVRVLEPDHLPSSIRAFEADIPTDLSYPQLKDRVLDDAGRAYFEALLARHRGNVSKIAQHAGLDRRHIHRLLQRLSLDPSAYRGT